MRFTVLASGSGGNASLVEVDNFGVLIDGGLGPRQIGDRLGRVGLSWSNIHAALLTHTHSDHWKDRTFARLRKHRIPLYCHAEHQRILLSYSQAFPDLVADGLVRFFAGDSEFALAPGLHCRPLSIRHDGGPTFGFRLDGDA